MAHFVIIFYFPFPILSNNNTYMLSVDIFVAIKIIILFKLLETQKQQKKKPQQALTAKPQNKLKPIIEITILLF